MRREHAWSAVVLSFALAGCNLVDMVRDNKEMKKFSTISGRILKHAPSDNPIVVALISDAIKRENVVNAKQIESKEFSFGAPPGNYFIFAFEDTNRDYRFHAGEPAGFHGNPTPIVLRPGASRTDILINLRPNLKLPASAKSGRCR